MLMMPPLLPSPQDVSYTVINSQNSKEKLTILHSISGYLKPGDMAALMGPSGSGESALEIILGTGRGWVGVSKRGEEPYNLPIS